MFPDRIAPPLRLGLVGGGIHSAVGYCHYAASRMDGYWSLESGCFSVCQEENHATAQAYGVGLDRCYPDWRTLLQAESGRLDAIAVISPTPTHYEIVSACLEAGFPVICEKALVSTLEDANRIRTILDDKQGFLAVTYNYTGYPMLRELRRRIAAGDLGKIRHFYLEMPQEGFLRTDAEDRALQPQSWRLQDGRIPTLYLDLATHVHQLLHYLTNCAPLSVVTDQISCGNFPNVIDHVEAMLRCTNGVRGSIRFGKSSLGHRNGLRVSVYGDHASAQWEQNYPEELMMAYRDGAREIVDAGAQQLHPAANCNARFKAGHPVGFVEAFANLYTDIATALRDHISGNSKVHEEVMGVDVAREGLRLFEAMVASVQNTAWVKVEDG